jgi:hypothetical protein
MTIVAKDQSLRTPDDPLKWIHERVCWWYKSISKCLHDPLFTRQRT